MFLENEEWPCPSCDGCGWWDIGDVEDGVTDECTECQGTGVVKGAY